MSDAAAAGLKELGLRTSEAAALGLTATPCERAGADALRAATRLTTAKIQCMDLRRRPFGNADDDAGVPHHRAVRFARATQGDILAKS